MSRPTRIMGIDPGADTGIAVIEAVRDEPKYPPPVPGVFWWIRHIETVREILPDERIRIAHDCWSLHGNPAVAVQVPLSKGKTAFWSTSQASLVRHAYFVGQLVEHFRAVGGRVVEIPSQECKSAGMKMDKKAWAETWRHEGRTSEHARDAAQIALLGASRLARGG